MGCTMVTDLPTRVDERGTSCPAGGSLQFPGTVPESWKAAPHVVHLPSAGLGVCRPRTALMASDRPQDPPWAGGPTDPGAGDGGPPTYGQPSFGADPTAPAEPGWGAGQGWGQAPGYGQPPGPAPGYGQPPGYGYAQPGWGAAEHPQGTTILVLGICSLVFGFSCGVGFLLGPVAWIMGNSAIREIDADPSRFGNRGSVQAGRICGIVSSAIIALGVVVLVAAVLLGRSS